MPETIHTDVIVVGAGPAGSTCAVHLANQGISCVLVDKATFPRDKVCGDVLGSDVVEELILMGSQVPKQFESFQHKSPYDEAKFITPSYECLHLHIRKKYDGFIAPSFVAERFHFDNFLFEEAKRKELVKVYEGTQIVEVIPQPDHILLKSKDEKFLFKARMAIGADGAHS